MIRLLAVLFCLPGISCGDTSEPSILQTPSPQSITFVTYNVLADSSKAKLRGPALVKILEQSGADVIALQEVTPWFLAGLLRNQWVQDNYNGIITDGKPAAPGGLYILSKFPIREARFEPLPENPKRLALVARLNVPGGSLAVATAHLESPLRAGPARAKQLDFIFGLLGPASEAVFLGDFNFGDGEKEGARIPPEFADVWRTLHPKDPGYTWNIEKSRMARAGSFPGETSRRIDRILVRSKIWTCGSTRILGDSPLPRHDGLFPSDHFGLMGVLKRVER